MSSQKLAIHGGQPTAVMAPRLSTLGEEEAQAVHDVIAKGMLSEFRGGPQVKAFEQAFAKYVGTKYAIATTSGTTALHASVAALDLGPDDEVLVPALTFVSTASVVLQSGAKVVFVDIDDGFCMDSKDLERKITSHSKAIIPVHLYGRVTEMDSLLQIARLHNLIVIEDACQAHGALYKNTKSGNLGDVGCFSFYETKNMTCGEGGMVTTSDDELYKEICLRREHGSPRGLDTWYAYVALGYNYNMTELQGAIGQVQLKKLDTMNKGRIANAALYDKYLKNLGLTLPPKAANGVNVYHNYPVLLPAQYKAQRDFFVKAMRAEGIPIDVSYPCTLYETEYFKQQGITGDCPQAEDMSARLFTLFTDASITEESIRLTATAIEKVMAFMQKAEVDVVV